MSSAPSSASGRVIHRICPSCDKDVTTEDAKCPTCGTKLVEIRDEADATVGTVIDQRFEVRDKIGQGGMGTVYRAWQRSVGREVAIKLIDRSFSRDPMGVRRFLREARLASQLSQPNTVSVFDFGQAEDGRLFIAMELLRGKTLYQLIQPGPFSVERTKRVGLQICDALEAAHALGIVHRDLKLENVIVLDHPPGRDHVKVLDFGLAKNIHDPGSRATESGIVVGTPRYMSPEATMSGTSSTAGDIYSLGVILGELVTGKPLWEGDNLPQLLGQKMDIGTTMMKIPGPLRTTVRAMLDTEPERRPTAAQARAMLADIEAANAGDTVLDPGPLGKQTFDLRRKSDAKSESDPYAATRQLEPTPKPTPQPEPSASTSAAAAASSVSITDQAASKPARRVALVAMFGAAAMVAVAAVIFIKMQSSSSTPAVAVPRDAAVAMTTPIDAAIDAPPPPPLVTTKIESKPAGATVVVDGVQKKTPFELELGEPVTLEATLPGYVPVKFTVEPGKPLPPIVLKKKPRATTNPNQTPF